MPEGMEDAVWGWLLDVITSLHFITVFLVCCFSQIIFRFRPVNGFVYYIYVNVGESGTYIIF